MAKVGVESLIISSIEEKPQEKPIDREKTCPLLLRVFWSNDHHNNKEDYIRGNFPPNELQIYTWKDATLDELSNLVKEVLPETRRKGTVFDFAIVFPDLRTPQVRMREVGQTVSGYKTADSSLTLNQLRFNIGFYMDISISQPYRNWNPLMRSGPRNNRARPY